MRHLLHLAIFAALVSMANASGACDDVKLDRKCNQGASRLFRSSGTNLEGCQKQCADTTGCSYYSFAKEGQYAGACMGCAAEEDAETHVGFVLYSLICQGEKSDQEEVVAPADHRACPEMRINTKCPYKHEDRLFRLEGQTMESCQQTCLVTPGCHYYSFAPPGADNGYEGVCMGCDSDVAKEAHDGFNLYAVSCLGDKIIPDFDDQFKTRRLESSETERFVNTGVGTRPNTGVGTRDDEETERFVNTGVGTRDDEETERFVNTGVGTRDDEDTQTFTNDGVGSRGDGFMNDGVGARDESGSKTFTNDGVGTRNDGQTFTNDGVGARDESGTETFTNDGVGSRGNSQTFANDGVESRGESGSETFTNDGVGSRGDGQTFTNDGVGSRGDGQTFTNDGVGSRGESSNEAFADEGVVSRSAGNEAKQVGSGSRGSGSGDPHFKTWTGDKYDYHGECDLVLLHHPTFDNGKGMRVHVRTTQVGFFSYIEKVALQIGDDVLEFENDVDNFLINGKVVEPNQKHHKTMLGGYRIRRDPRAISVLLHNEGYHVKGLAKVDFHMRKNGFPAVIVDAGHTDVFAGSLGMLGDWSTGMKMARDGSTEITLEDPLDGTAMALEWQVRDTEPHLFQDHRSPQYPTTCIPQKRIPKRLGMDMARKEAEEACAHWAEDMDDCIFDVMATRDVLVASEGHIVHVE